MDALLKKFADDPRLSQLADGLTMHLPNRVQLNHLLGSSSQFVAAVAMEHPALSSYNHVFVLNDAEAAAYFHNSLENLTKALHLYYFPSSFKHRRNFSTLHPSHLMMRTEALTRFATANGKKAGVLVTYPEALFEKVVQPKKLEGNLLLIKTNDTLDVDGMLQMFVSLGFTRTDFVYEPGQFALRGGILDVYSFGNEKPYRIELFGNEVDSIRIFDPESQLSERRLLQVSIIPNVETQYESGEKISVFDFLPKQTIFWVSDYAFTKEAMLQLEEECAYFLTQRGNQQRKDADEGDIERAALTADDFITASMDYYLDIINLFTSFLGSNDN